MFEKNFKNHFEYQIVANLKVLNRNTHFYDVPTCYIYCTNDL